MKKILKNKKAFTLTELIVVIAIIGILAAVLIPSLTGYIQKAKESTALQEAHAITSAYDVWVIQEAAKSVTSDKTDEEKEKEFIIYIKDELKILNFTAGTEVAIIDFIYTVSNGLLVDLTVNGNHLTASISSDQQN